MRPETLEAFLDEFKQAWVENARHSAGNADQHHRDFELVGKRMGHLVDAIVDGLRTPDIHRRLTDLERRREELIKTRAAPPIVIPRFPDNLVNAYKPAFLPSSNLRTPRCPK